MDESRSTTGKEIPPIISTRNQSSSKEEWEEEWTEKNRREKENRRKRLFIDLLGGITAFDYSLDNFPRKTIPAFQTALRFDPHDHNVYFWGPSGTGKSYLALALAHKFWDLGKTVYVSSVRDLRETLVRLKSNFSYAERERFINFFIQADVLVLDELGRGTVTDQFQEEILYILEHRILAGRNGFIGTGNYSPQEIGERMGDSFLRRIKDLCGIKGIIQFPARSAEV